MATVPSTQTQQLQVTCKTLADRTSGHEGITHLNAGGYRWTREAVIAEIESPYRRYNFVVRSGFVVSHVLVVNGYYGKYLRCFANGTANDNLLSLPDC